MSTRSLLRSTGVIGFATATSRVLGFIRDILEAFFFGTTTAFQAFIVAFRIPNMLRDFVAEGATNAAFVPVLSEYLVTKGKEEFRRLSSVLLANLTLVLVAIVIVGSLAAPLIVRVIAPGLSADPANLELTVRLTRIVFSYILLMGLAAYAMGVLNTLKHFSVPAFAPALLNISIIAAILIFRRNLTVVTLTMAVLVGGVLQLLIQIPVLRKKGISFSLPKTLAHPAAKRILTLLVPRALGSAVYHVNILVDTMLASLYWIVGSGGIAALYYSYRLIQLPTAIFGTSLATAALPTLSTHFAKKDMEGFRETLNISLKTLFLIMLPSTAGFIVLGNDIVRILFERGEFTAYSTMITTQALVFYSIGLFSYAGIKILVFSFYSMQDTMTPVKTAATAMVINVLLNLILMWPLKLGGLALATSVAGICNFFILWHLLRKRIGSIAFKDTLGLIGKSACASVIMGSSLFIGTRYFNGLLPDKGIMVNASSLILLMAAGIVIYFVLLYLFRVKELSQVIRWISKTR